MTSDPAELATLQRYLTWQREHVLGALEDLTDEQLRAPALPSGWSPLGLVQHLALDVERFWFRAVVGGETVELSETAWKVPAETSAGEIIALYKDEIARADAIIAATPLDAEPAFWPEPGPPDRRVHRATILHVIVETATHAGHLDAARELIDGKAWLVLT